MKRITVFANKTITEQLKKLPKAVYETLKDACDDATCGAEIGKYETIAITHANHDDYITSGMDEPNEAHWFFELEVDKDFDVKILSVFSQSES